ncbi:hypothetical protein COLO4_05491 [Corchorus olitorius]|uniref:Uncharacterized protein n=1 Tax=Corchorus olitorius TaxID=93759 RepID=A0A1R3KQU2_9ROSI|nr:hypothetical protein COLO4_05491 [Corchorus olitorius]
MRDRLRNVPNGSEDEKKKEEEKKAVWNPTFQPEDFMDQDSNSKSKNIIPDLKQGAVNGDIAGTSSNREEEETKKEDSGLDLKLSL